MVNASFAILRLRRTHGGGITSIFEALDILEAWLFTPYEGWRHGISLGLIAEAEKSLSETDG